MSPELGWEVGTAPYLGLTPNVVFANGLAAGARKNTFTVFYGGADSVLGSAEITVEFN